MKFWNIVIAAAIGALIAAIVYDLILKDTISGMFVKDTVASYEE